MSVNVLRGAKRLQNLKIRAKDVEKSIFKPGLQRVARKPKNGLLILNNFLRSLGGCRYCRVANLTNLI